MTKKVMVSPLAGQWFQDSERALRDEIAERSKGITVIRKKNVCAAVVPHAGYRYSGHVAAGVYLRIDPKRYSRIVVMGPSHYVAMHNQISVPDATHFATPLGELRADTEFVARARKLPFVTHQPAAHAREHSDQIQLPLIQACLATNIPVVCMVCGQFDAASLVSAAAVLKELLDERTLFVASSDFTHFGANFGYVPFDKDVFKNLENLDLGIFELFIRKDVAGFMKRLDETGATVCGRDPLAFLLAMLPEDASVERTAYETSGQMLHDTHSSVSYIGALVTGTWAPSARSSVTASSADGKIPETDCERLLTLARETITRALKTGAKSAAAAAPEDVTEGMKAVRGGFVTLHKQGELRGCIGEIVPRREVWKVVREQALNAAFHDPRFPPLAPDELDAIDIEISMLTPPKPVASWKEIVVGRHGMVLSKGGRSAVFLPQVAPEQGWGIEETLTHLAMKAGLPPDAWRSGADFLVFEAQVIRERK
ncbi:MAG TPA: AmmeMemoRadiSam system protein B [Kiritimatiellia bacterium]|nr:AmmeMemoRadiSam system protein B [Kiritimatiellia bacterium]HPS08399.1 AmmeMemoRadiSam system protein B [Kiritimatiellia bacterium]